MYDSIEYNDNCYKPSGSLWHYYRDEPYLNADGTIIDFLTLIVIIVLCLNLKQK